MNLATEIEKEQKKIFFDRLTFLEQANIQIFRAP